MRSPSFWSLSLAAATIFGLIGNCAADPLGFLGNVILETQAQAAREAWARVLELDRFCVARALDTQGTNLPSIIRSGIMPGDPRLASFEAQCRRFNEAALRRGYSCTILDEASRSVSSTCNQSFAKRGPDGRSSPVLIREAIDLHFSGIPLSVVDIETDTARQDRRERREAVQRLEKLTPLRAQISDLRRSPSPVVRAEAEKWLSSLERYTSSGSGLRAEILDDLVRSAQALKQLSEAEAHIASLLLIGSQPQRRMPRLARRTTLPMSFDSG